MANAWPWIVKAIESFARHGSNDATPDGRRDTDADWGKKTYRGVNAKGKAWEQVTAWFGYKIHLLVDATYELPIAWTVTKASTADITEAPTLLAQLTSQHPKMLSAAQHLAADRGYDATAWVQSVWDDHGIKPVTDIRNMWKDRPPECCRVTIRSPIIIVGKSFATIPRRARPIRWRTEALTPTATP